MHDCLLELVLLHRGSVFVWGPVVNQWAWGYLTPQMVNQIAKLLKRDLQTPGLNLDLVTTLTEIGSGGTHKQNMLRDLAKSLPENPMPELRFHGIPIDHPVLGKSTPQFPFIDPHEMFSVLYHEYPQAFFKYVVPSAGELESFWDSVSGGRGPVLYGCLVWLRSCCLKPGCARQSLGLCKTNSK
mgnify:CR=1 FL=1|tara:strand:- start:1734 stop:2285 length:552 start_codon:yes stop_codon:yes gene_type:complete